MLRPKQMSKVSVTGSKRVMEPVIETVHDLNLVHVSDYDGSWEGFDPGDPVEGAEEASEKLVTVRSIESILDVDPEDAGPTRIVTEEALEDELEDVRQQVNELDDRRDDLRDDLRDVEEQIDRMEPFVELGIDLDLLRGYDTLQVAVGEGDEDEIRRVLVDEHDVREFELFSEGGIVAVFAYPHEDADEDTLQDALVGADFAAIDVPDAEGSPEEHVRELEHREQQLRSKLNTVEDEIEELKIDFAGFLLAAEEKLSIDVQKTEAPLSFATTENAFIAEGWIPTERYDEFEAALTDAVGDRVEVEELERAEFKSSGEHHAEAVADGGTATIGDDEPPVVQDNPGVVKPFEVLVQAVSRPSYKEFDPTVVLFLTFPAFFGFMIGDLGYGILYTLIGWYLYSSFESEGFKSMGGVTITAGLFTMLFGILYGEVFGTHMVTKYLWEGVFHMHGAPIHKGLMPANLYWAQAWLAISVAVGVVHMNVGFVFDFVENYQLHDVKHAVYESASWILMLNGLWIWVFSKPQGPKPGFIYTVFGSGKEAAFALGFTGFSPVVGYLGAGAFALGFVLLAIGEPIEVVEFLQVLVNALSYTRIAAVLLAKAGMAFTVNLLFFGAYEHHGKFHFMYKGAEHVEKGEILFGGLMHGGVAMLLVGLLILVLGHGLVLALGVTSAGLQAVRLEYVEFFQKFYSGGGRAYQPFGYEREFTQQD